MKIKKVIAREIFDSRGRPTLECQLTLTDGTVILSSVPSGASKSTHAAAYVLDEQRLGGYGVSKAIRLIEEHITPLLLNATPDLYVIDEQLMILDGTCNKSKLGANTMLAVSQAVVRAQAHVNGIPLYELIAHLMGHDGIRLPFPMFNMIEGGVHADNNLVIQEFLIIPVGYQCFREAMEQATMVYHCLRKILQKRGNTILVADEGGFAPMLTDERAALDLLVQALEETNCIDNFGLAIDVAASQFYDSTTKSYQWGNSVVSSDDLINYYKKLVAEYPLFSIEDGLAQDDWAGWQSLTSQLGSSIQLVGDDLLATSMKRLEYAIERNVANALVCKPNQVGTVSEALAAIQLAQQHDYNIIISHRSAETEDTFIADLAVGVGAGQIKAGGCSRTERMAKYNRLLRIEDALIFNLFD